MALVRRMIEQLADDYQREGAAKKRAAEVARTAGQEPAKDAMGRPDVGGRELALVATVRSMAAAFGRLDTHQEAVLAGFTFLSSEPAVARQILFAPPQFHGGLKGRAATLKEFGQRLRTISDGRQVRTFGRIPGVLSQASVVWTLVAKDAEQHVASEEVAIEAMRQALPPTGNGEAAKKVADDLNSARMAAAAMGTSQMGYKEAKNRVALLESAYEVARSQTSEESPERKTALAEIVERETATGRERQMVKTWGREAQVLREAARLDLSLGSIPEVWSRGPVVMLSEQMASFQGDVMVHAEDRSTIATLASAYGLEIGQHGWTIDARVLTRVS